MYFNGLFENNSFFKGKLYDPLEKIIYEGEFNNYYPKEYKNIKLYYLDGSIKFEGDIINSQEKGIFYDYDDDSTFEGILEFGNKIKGSYYVNKIKKYEGEFKDNKYNGYGKLFELDYENNIYLYYEGNFKDNQINGKGIKYYQNNIKKVEGIFRNINSYNGIYYDPDEKQIFEGDIIDEVPFINDKRYIYNDEGKLIYNPNDYNEDIIKINDNKDIFDYSYQVILISSEPSGKSQILLRIKEKPFEAKRKVTVGVESYQTFYKYKNKLYKSKIIDTSYQDVYKNRIKGLIKSSNVIIIIFDLSSDYVTYSNLIDYIKQNSGSKEKLIYLVGNKLDITYKGYLEFNRKKAKLYIDTGKINKYFELSAKTCEGFQEFYNVLRIDAAIFMDSKNKAIEKSSNITTSPLSFSDYHKFKKLYSYIDY